MSRAAAGPRLGFLYPGVNVAEDDYPALAARLRAAPSVVVVNTSVGEDAHRIDALLDLGGPDRLRQGADALAGRVDAVVWACTSGSFVFGWEGARRQADALGSHLGVPASSTSFAFVEALSALHLDRVAVAATYPEDVAAAFATFLGAAGIEVVAVGAEGVITAAEVGTFGRDRVVEFVAAGDHPEAEAVLVPDTALHTVAWIDDLERALAKPVLTANQVTLWEGLRLTGALGPETGPGALFRIVP